MRLSSANTSEDSLILVYMGAAEDHIVNYIDGPIPGTTDSPPTSPPFAIQAAHLLLVSGMYENRESESDVKLEENPALVRLLYPYRKLGI